MTAYSVEGSMVPNAATENTGESAGVYNGQPYWSWITDGYTWVLRWTGVRWSVVSDAFSTGSWIRDKFALDPIGAYAPTGSFTGVVNVAEVAEDSSVSSLSSPSSVSTASSCSNSSMSSGSSLSSYSSSSGSSMSTSTASSASSSTPGLGLFPIEVSVTFSGKMTVSVTRRS